MTVLDRQHYRELLVRREVERAARRARTLLHRSNACRQAMAETGTAEGRPSERHAQCKEEEPGGHGCLCECHDEWRIGGHVTVGTVIEMGSDIPESS